ncbi:MULTISPECIES: GNAT family N-acetyltransferase [Pseudonocardia]|uniref:GNAT family N-acetyltransferase n=1 Tax=Pseudonocardia TaxID=1847 RepID=UPI0013026475|nr:MULTISPECIES: GNAT family N-acetyltransferase [Pseudonocardia]
MSAEHHVQVLTDPADRRAAYDVFVRTLHRGPVQEADWESHGQSPDEHWLGVRGADGEMVGSAFSFPTRLTLPGGGRVPAAAVSAVGVRADHTRAGRLTALMHAQLTAARERGDAATVLRASEAAIYGRFGYGIASRGDHVQIAARPQWRRGAPEPGRVRMLGAAEAMKLLPELQERLAATRPGALTRNARWWRRGIDPGGKSAGDYRGIALHTGPDGDDGFAVWGIREGERFGRDEIVVHDLWAASPSATAGLWRFLTGIDLVSGVTAWSRPRDEDLDLMLDDPRLHRITGRGDDLWLRIVDVPAAFGARAWGAGEPVVLRLHDPLFDDAGTWRLGPEGAAPAGDAMPDLECGLESLAPAFLGDRAPSALVAAGRWSEHTAGAAARADALFAVPGAAPWCGTFF